jgi:hypothetical protein
MSWPPLLLARVPLVKAKRGYGKIHEFRQMEASTIAPSELALSLEGFLRSAKELNTTVGKLFYLITEMLRRAEELNELFLFIESVLRGSPDRQLYYYIIRELTEVEVLEERP